MSQVEIIFGIHSVQAALKTTPDRVSELVVLNSRNDQRILKLVDLAKRQSVPVRLAGKKEIENLTEGNHQGVVARVKPGKTFAEKDLYEMIAAKIERGHDPLVLVLDGVTDPHNLGACIRSADAAGVDALVFPKDNSASVNDVVRKVACGAAEKVPVIAVTNLARTLNKLKDMGLWVAGAAGEASDFLYDISLTGPRVIVVGAEGTGMRRLTRETCDELVKIPMLGSVSSLNVSVATGILLFEVVRQRRSS